MTTELIKSFDPRLAVGTVWGKVPSSGCYGSTKHATKRLGVFFLFGAGEFREVDFLIMENVKRGTKATHLERSNGYDPELNLKVRESSGSVRLECFLTERKHIMRLPDQTTVYWNWRPAGSNSRGEGNVTIKGLATSSEGTIKGEENTNVPGRFTGH